MATTSNANEARRQAYALADRLRKLAVHIENAANEFSNPDAMPIRLASAITLDYTNGTGSCGTHLVNMWEHVAKIGSD